MLRRIKWEESLVCGEQQFPPFFFYFPHFLSPCAVFCLWENRQQTIMDGGRSCVGGGSNSCNRRADGWMCRSRSQWEGCDDGERGRSRRRQRPIRPSVDRQQATRGRARPSARETHTQTNKDAVCRCWMLNSLVGRRQTNSSLSLSPRSSTEVKRP